MPPTQEKTFRDKLQQYADELEKKGVPWGSIHEHIEGFHRQELETLLDEVFDEVKALKPVMEDDTLTTIYRHCEEGDHWKCSGYGENEECVCKCHSLVTLETKLTALRKECAK